MSDALLRVDAMACAAGPRTLFEGLSLALPAGRWAMLTGPNGSGKTTLLRALAGLVRPLGGTLHWNDRPARAGTADWQAKLAYVGHAPGAKAELSTRDNLALQLALDRPDGVPAPALDAALARVGLSRQRALPFGRLSAGQRRRLGLARLLCVDRPLWLLDEPTTALDQDGLALLAAMLDEHLDAGGCAIVATHQPLSNRHAPMALTLDAFRPAGPGAGPRAHP